MFDTFLVKLGKVRVKSTYGNILDNAILCIGCGTGGGNCAEIILDVVESWDRVRCRPAWFMGCWARRNGYLHGEFGTSFWKPRLSTPLPCGSFVLDDSRRKIREPRPGGSSKPLLLRFRYRTSCDSSRITWRSYGVS